MRYQVIVGNIGTVCDTDNRQEAYRDYNTYCGQSVIGVGRAAGETVTLILDNEPLIEHVGSPCVVPLGAKEAIAYADDLTSLMDGDEYSDTEGNGPILAPIRDFLLAIAKQLPQ